MRDGSRLVIGATTVALIGLSTVGTSVLVDNGTRTLNPDGPRALPRTPSSPAPSPGPLVVARPAGSFVPPGEHPGPVGRLVPNARLVVLAPLPVEPLLPQPTANGPSVLPRVLPGTGIVAEPAPTVEPTPEPDPEPTPEPTETSHGKAHAPRPAHDKPDHPHPHPHPTPHGHKK